MWTLGRRHGRDAGASSRTTCSSSKSRCTTPIRGATPSCAATTDVPIAGGECLTASYEWRVFAEQDCFDIGQPDASFTGGLGEFMKVAAMLAEPRPQDRHARLGRGRVADAERPLRASPPQHADPRVPPTTRRTARGHDRRRARDRRTATCLPPDRPGLGIVLTDEIKRRYPLHARQRRIQQRARESAERLSCSMPHETADRRADRAARCDALRAIGRPAVDVHRAVRRSVRCRGRAHGCAT